MSSLSLFLVSLLLPDRGLEFFQSQGIFQKIKSSRTVHFQTNIRHERLNHQFIIRYSYDKSHHWFSWAAESILKFKFWDREFQFKMNSLRIRQSVALERRFYVVKKIYHKPRRSSELKACFLANQREFRTQHFPEQRQSVIQGPSGTRENFDCIYVDTDFFEQELFDNPMTFQDKRRETLMTSMIVLICSE